MWELDYKESWALKNWCFWTMVLEKTLKSPLDCKRSNTSILKEISPECLLEGLILMLKLPYFGHLMRSADLFEKTLRLGKIEGKRRRGQQRMRWLDGITISMDMSLSNLCREAWHVAVHGVTKSQTQLSDWTELNGAWLIASLSQTELWSTWEVWLVSCDCGFHSVFLLMDEDKRFVEASWWEGLAVA